jgi:hypothetical protein
VKFVETLKRAFAGQPLKFRKISTDADPPAAMVAPPSIKVGSGVSRLGADEHDVPAVCEIVKLFTVTSAAATALGLVTVRVQTRASDGPDVLVKVPPKVDGVMTHAAAPAELVVEPGGQATQELLPGSAWNWPAGHSWHAIEP